MAEVATERKEGKEKESAGGREGDASERERELTLSTEDDHGDTVRESVLHRSDDVRSSRSAYVKSMKTNQHTEQEERKKESRERELTQT